MIATNQHDLFAILRSQNLVLISAEMAGRDDNKNDKNKLLIFLRYLSKK